MKIFKKVVIIISVIAMVVVFALHVAVNIKGKDILTRKLKEVFKREVTIGKLNTYFLLNVYMEDIDVKGLFHIDKVFAVGGIFDIFRKDFHLTILKVVHPVVTLDKEYLGFASRPFATEEQSNPSTQNEELSIPSVSQGGLQPVSNRPPEFTIKRLIVNDGVLNYIDKINDTESVSVKVEDIYLNVHNLNFTSRNLKKFSVDLKGIIIWQEENKGELAVKGWMDYSNKNMDMNLNLHNIDYRAFSPYYPPFWKPDNLGVKEAFLSLEADLNSKRNDLSVDTTLALERIAFKEGLEDNSKINYLRTIIALVQGLQSKPVIRFKLNTKMDSPKLDFAALKHDFRGIIRMKPAMIVEGVLDATKGKVTEGAKVTKEVTVDSAVEAIKGVVSAIKGAIKNEESDKPLEVPVATSDMVNATNTSVVNATNTGEVNETAQGNISR
ncbi:MAG: DUF748 domain-containing protein [Candidatus Omnitrophica bacterium]|nr:DUF748 domain-containing protein [Candidatus Omnitrophota bacterium]